MQIGTIHRWNGTTGSLKVICLHGFLGSGADFEIIADRLVNQVTLVAPDFPDFSSPYAKAYNWRDCLTALDAFIRAESKEAPSTLLGYSMGGRIALQYAIHHSAPLKSLVLVGATPGIADATERQRRFESDQVLAKQLREQSLPAFLDHWYQQPLIQSQETIPEPYRTRMRHRRNQCEKDALAEALQFLGTGTMEPAWHHLKNISVPTLLATGEHDPKFHGIAVEMLAHIPNAQHQTIRGAGHTCCFENPNRFATMLTAFLSSQTNK